MPLHEVPRANYQQHASSKELPLDIVVVPPIGIQSPAIVSKLSKSLSDHGLFGRFLTDASSLSRTARVLLYGYRSDERNGMQENEVHRHAEQLLQDLQAQRGGKHARNQIHFVAHSTGGLVVKQALLLARQSCRDVQAFCHSVAFFGVPQIDRGSCVLSEEPFAQAVAENLHLEGQLSPHLSAFVAPGGKEIGILDFDFQNIAKKLRKIWIFVETKDTEMQVTHMYHPDEKITIRSAIVDERSAVLSHQKRGNETIIRMNRTHAELLMPARTENPNPLDNYLQDLQLVCTEMLQKQFDLEETIKKSLHVELHLFYDGSDKGDGTSIRLWSVNPTIEKFLEVGLKECFKERLQPPNEDTPEISIPKINIPEVSGTRSPPPNAPVRRHSAITITALRSDIDDYGMHVVPDFPLAPPTSALPELEMFSFGTRPASPNIPPNPEIRDQPRSSSVGSNTAGEEINARSSARRGHRKSKHSSIHGLRGGKARVKSIPENWKDPVNYSTSHRVGMTFKLPVEERRKFHWVHVPCNVAGWVPDFMEQLILEKGSRQSPQVSLYDTILHPKSFDHKQNLARHGQPHSRFMSPSFDLFHGPKQTHACIFMPYLHWDSLKSLMKRSQVIQNRLKHQQPPHPADDEIKNCRSMELKLIWQYLYGNSDTTVHHRRSLDQYGYPNLGSTETRDRDQVITKCFRRVRDLRSNAAPKPIPRKQSRNDISSSFFHPAKKLHKSSRPEPADDSGNVIMIDQLWCWVIDEGNVLTFFTPKEGEPEDQDSSAKLADLHESLYKDVNGDPRFATQCTNVFDLAALVVSHAVKVFLEDTTDRDLDVFNVFEEYITYLTEKRTESFKEFQSRYDDGGPYRSPGKRDTSNALSRLQEKDLLATADDLKSLLELQDIHDELSTLLKLFRDQESVVTKMRNEYKAQQEDKKSGKSMENGTKLLDSSLERIEGYQKQVITMQNQCKATETAFTDLLNMKQRQASVAEAWATREANETASGTSRSVLIFTVFTIIFLPLSFFTGLFGMNVRRWSGSQYNPELHNVLLLMFTISTAVTVAALFIAFNKSMWRYASIIFTFAWAKPPSDKSQEYVEGAAEIQKHLARLNSRRTDDELSLMETGSVKDISPPSTRRLSLIPLKAV